MGRGLSLLVALVCVACGTAGRGSTATATGDGSDSPSAPAAPLVGDWQRSNSCPMLIRALREARLPELASESLVRAWFFDRDDEIDAAHPCRGAANKPIYIFFTPDGRFGAIDEDDVLVESATYALRGRDAFTIHARSGLTSGSAIVRYRTMGHAIRFDVMVPHPCRAACRAIRSWAFSIFSSGRFERRP